MSGSGTDPNAAAAQSSQAAGNTPPPKGRTRIARPHATAPRSNQLRAGWDPPELRPEAFEPDGLPPTDRRDTVASSAAATAIQGRGRPPAETATSRLSAPRLPRNSADHGNHPWRAERPAPRLWGRQRNTTTNQAPRPRVAGRAATKAPGSASRSSAGWATPPPQLRSSGRHSRAPQQVNSSFWRPDWTIGLIEKTGPNAIREIR